MSMTIEAPTVPTGAEQFMCLRDDELYDRIASVGGLTVVICLIEDPARDPNFIFVNGIMNNLGRRKFDITCKIEPGLDRPGSIWARVYPNVAEEEED